ncbi:carboxylesterase family protein [Chryseobacterium oryctis]|uniref:Carboxylic ester hydrolase n=1 Tax=Chryseobacterium oryctis TaxID=2952618 RepID=A0ABT3HK94_9FLAO|nr:carboxylesterase family protein [Chryseobacterium oryctis]MCW3160191.1 carboxylesterase family protein [Chryseobacterium oryctis]
MTSQQNIETHTFQTPFGKILALKENKILKVRSIRYARSERYKKPVPVEPSDSEFIFPEKIPVCPQVISPLIERMIAPTDIESYEVEESTQFLSVYRPENCNENEKIPIVVWIHGGSHEIGCGDVSTADPTEWVKEQNIMVVTVSYRLGLFGFLGGNENRPPNLGLMDVIEALKWIKNNIQFFGGNPENITLLGQSSGGDLIAHLMLSEGMENLFQRVIIQSAPLGLRHNRQKMSAEFLKKTEHLKDETDVFKMMDDYRNFVPSIARYGLKAAMPFGLQYGFYPLCKENEAVGKWKQSAGKIDVLIGLNDDETALYLKTSEQLNRYLSKGLGKKILNKTVRLTTETIYGKPAKIFAENYAQAGGNVYLFRIHSKLKTNYLGAPHCIDLPLIFGNESAWKSAELLKDIPWEYIDKNGKKIRSLWAEFASSGKISRDSEIPDILELRKI